MTTTETTDETVAQELKGTLESDDWTVFDTPDYVGVGIIRDGKPYIVVVLEAKVSEAN